MVLHVITAAGVTRGETLVSIVIQVEKEACEAKLSKLRLQNKAKVASLSSQLEQLKRQGEPGTPPHSKKVSTPSLTLESGKKSMCVCQRLKLTHLFYWVLLRNVL